MHSVFAATLHQRIARLEANATLFDPEQLHARMEALDQLDALLPDAHSMRIDSQLARALALREKLEAANSAIYEAIRNQISAGCGAESLHKWIDHCRGAGTPQPGLGYDHLDELIAGVLALKEPVSETALASEMVFYQPTPARHILEMLRLSVLSEDDVLIDLGSGLGHVPMLSSILTRARAIGFEIDPAFVRCAHQCAQNLGINRVTFIQQDARNADLSAGTVFHLYTPFTGGILRSVLDQLRCQAGRRQIRVCTLGPCTPAVAEQPWLQACTPVDPERIVCFSSRIIA